MTEGEATEPQYLNGLARYARATGLVVSTASVFGIGRDPLSVVRRAVVLRDEDNSKNRSPRDRYESIWCVFDVDEHATIDAALIEAQAEGFKVGVSNPCFEIWLLWHFEDHFAEISRKNLRNKLKPRGCGEKKIPRNFDYSKFQEASRRARSRPSVKSDYSIPANPGTGVLSLVGAVMGGGT
ncbi:RloB family protein [Actinoplanes sp. G11-F43]|uniref:RloB family protein n=1 Tax=Actinoplanes sp. G11-F43 TaxID=3424130 RepID=UPI003D342A78